MVMIFGRWNARNPYRTGSLTTVARRSAKCKLDLVGIVCVRWDRGGVERAGNCTLLYELRAGFFVHKEIMAAVKRVEPVIDIMSYIQGGFSVRAPGPRLCASRRPVRRLL
jgi:hypothetical protein